VKAINRPKFRDFGYDLEKCCFLGYSLTHKYVGVADGVVSSTFHTEGVRLRILKRVDSETTWKV
jgi:hypothetical protein